MTELTREHIIKAARQAQDESDSPLSRHDFIRITGISEWQITKLFPEGRWTEVKKLAGIDRHPMDKESLSDEDVLKEFHRVISELKYIPTAAVFDQKAIISYSSIRRRFGGMRGALGPYRNWLQKNHPNSPLIELTEVESKHELPSASIISANTQNSASTKWSKIEGTEFGAPIDFRGLRHAPINEQGVVYLFGMVSYELGFIVEAVHSAFPDCEVKRHIGKDRWQRIRIEFEYKSKNFCEHGHDPAGADMIVCWIHDWEDCPLEVLELRKAIDQLEG